MSPEMAEGLRLAVVGVVTVFIALIITGILVVIIGRLTKDKPAAPAAAGAAALPEETFTGGLDRHKIVLLAAAASVAVKRPVRIRRVRFVAHKHIPTSWAAAGRTDHIQTSLD